MLASGNIKVVWQKHLQTYLMVCDLQTEDWMRSVHGFFINCGTRIVSRSPHKIILSQFGTTIGIPNHKNALWQDEIFSQMRSWCVGNLTGLVFLNVTASKIIVNIKAYDILGFSSKDHIRWCLAPRTLPYQIVSNRSSNAPSFSASTYAHGLC